VDQEQHWRLKGRAWVSTARRGSEALLELTLATARERKKRARGNEKWITGRGKMLVLRSPGTDEKNTTPLKVKCNFMFEPYGENKKENSETETSKREPGAKRKNSTKVLHRASMEEFKGIRM